LDWQALRHNMVAEQLAGRGITDSRVLDAMRHVPRHIFVPEEHQHLAYEDTPLPIGDHQTISQPFMVALMSQLLALDGHERVLEIGTGCGYQTAILGYLAKFVYSIERIPSLAGMAYEHLKALNITNVHIIIADGSYGLPDKCPYEGIMVTAVAPQVPRPLVSQLSRAGGRLVIPIGRGDKQELMLIQRQGDQYTQNKITPVRFVPLIGKFGFQPPED
jgi:protein-L-isoaspartate(D-aspartate) O-methyltransferase